MREVFHQSLEDVQARLVEISELVTIAVEKATRAFGTSAVSRMRSSAARCSARSGLKRWEKTCARWTSPEGPAMANA